MKTILVTGAAGTVGHHVCLLAEMEGYRVIASDRSARGVPVPARGEVRPADLRDPSSLPALLDGCDFVIHTAAIMEAWAAPGELARVNTDAVVELYHAAARAGVQRFVHLSTATLYRPAGGVPLREDAETLPRGAFGMSKHAAEVFLRAQGPHASVPWTILRPAPLYGRRGRHFGAYLMFVGPVLRTLLPMVPVLPRVRGGPRATMVHAEDVATAALHVMEHELASYEIYNVSDGDPLPLGKRIAQTLDAYHLGTVSLGRMPDAALSMLSRLFQSPAAFDGSDVVALALWKMVVLRHGLKPALRPRLDPEWLNLLTDDLVVDSSKLRALGWTPHFASFAEGFREVLRWYQAEGWVPRY